MEKSDFLVTIVIYLCRFPAKRSIKVLQFYFFFLNKFYTPYIINNTNKSLWEDFKILNDWNPTPLIYPFKWIKNHSLVDFQPKISWINWNTIMWFRIWLGVVISSLIVCFRLQNCLQIYLKAFTLWALPHLFSSQRIYSATFVRNNGILLKKTHT